MPERVVESCDTWDYSNTAVDTVVSHVERRLNSRELDVTDMYVIPGSRAWVKAQGTRANSSEVNQIQPQRHAIQQGDRLCLVTAPTKWKASPMTFFARGGWSSRSTKKKTFLGFLLFFFFWSIFGSILITLHKGVCFTHGIKRVTRLRLLFRLTANVYLSVNT